MIKPILYIDQELVLLPPHGALAEPLFELIEQQRAYLRNWMPWVDQVNSQEEMKQWLYDRHRYNQGGQHFTVFIQWQQSVVGSVGLIRIERRHRRAELGFWLSQPYQGKGLMTRCCQALIEYGFRQRHLNRLELYTAAENTPSRALAKRLGFTREGLLREYLRQKTSFTDMELFGLLCRDWQKTQKKL